MVNQRHKDFIENFQGESRGRYHITYLAIIRIVGGNDLRKLVQERYGRPVYKPEEMYPTREGAQMIIHAGEHGVPAERLGRMVPKTYERAQPEIFKDLTPEKAINLITMAYSEETSFGSTVTILEQGPGRAVIERVNSPMPCEFFSGVIEGIFEILDKPVEVKETRCQWKDDGPGCAYEITWPQ